MDTRSLRLNHSMSCWWSRRFATRRTGRGDTTHFVQRCMRGGFRTEPEMVRNWTQKPYLWNFVSRSPVPESQRMTSSCGRVAPTAPAVQWEAVCAHCCAQRGEPHSGGVARALTFLIQSNVHTRWMAFKTNVRARDRDALKMTQCGGRLAAFQVLC